MEKELYVMNRENLIYKVQIGNKIEVYNSCYYTCKLTLVTGIDFIDTDISDKQGWVNASRFNESVQQEEFTVNLFDESIIDRAIQEKYTIVKKLPVIN